MTEILIECEYFVICYCANIIFLLIAFLTCHSGKHFFSHMILVDYLFIYVLHVFVMLLLIFSIH